MPKHSYATDSTYLFCQYRSASGTISTLKKEKNNEILFSLLTKNNKMKLFKWNLIKWIFWFYVITDNHLTTITSDFKWKSSLRPAFFLPSMLIRKKTSISQTWIISLWISQHLMHANKIFQLVFIIFLLSPFYIHWVDTFLILIGDRSQTTFL